MIEVVQDEKKPVPVQLYAALVRAQAFVCGVEKSSTNDYHRYKYASAEDLVLEAKRALAHAELAVLATGWDHIPPKSGSSPDGELYVEEAARVAVTYRLVHSSGELLDFKPFSVPSLPEKGRPEDKAEASARTFALGYFLRDLLLIPRVDAPAPEEPPVDRRDDRQYEPRRPKPPKSPAVDFAPTAASVTVVAAIESAMRAAKSETQLAEAITMTIDAANDRRINREQYNALRGICAAVKRELAARAKDGSTTASAATTDGAPSAEA